MAKRPTEVVGLEAKKAAEYATAAKKKAILEEERIKREEFE